MNDLELKKSLLSCPGDTIMEHINEVGMSQTVLAEKMGRSSSFIKELIIGRAHIDKDLAGCLESVLDIPSSFWLNLEMEYHRELQEIEKLESFEF